jgi:glutamyl-tRNA synthetase
MPSDSVRLRFAPSPTGYLHVGGARTALFNWLYARKVGGKFLLRIEDTDKARSSDEHTTVIIDGLKWMGLDIDEEITFQGGRVKRHQEVAATLKGTGHTYDEDGALRLKMPEGEIAWEDFVHGPISFKGEDVKDWIILRSDGTPTYNFAVVVDDIDMRISHVMRGDDHISNTPKQIAVYRALGLPTPQFGHVPMIHGMDGKKLSKRHGATAVGDYQHQGILPGAMRNFLALLGWSPGGDRELFYELKEMIEVFTLEHLQRKAAIFDTKKLEWMNGQHLSHETPDALYPVVAPLVQALGITAGADAVKRCIAVVRERSRTTLDVAQQVAVRLDAAHVKRDDKAANDAAKDPDAYTKAVAAAAAHLGKLSDADWTAERLEAELRTLAEALGLPAGKVFQPIRIAVTGTTVSEPVHTLLWLVGKKASLERLAVT